MTEPNIEQTENQAFTDELSDEALDQPRQLPGLCCGKPGCQNLCPVFPSAPDR